MAVAWFYIDVPIEQVPKVPLAGWGSIPIMATVGKITWRTAIFRMKKDQYFMPLKKQIRTKEDILAGDTIKISYRVAIGAEI